MVVSVLTYDTYSLEDLVGSQAGGKNRDFSLLGRLVTIRGPHPGKKTIRPPPQAIRYKTSVLVEGNVLLPLRLCLPVLKECRGSLR